MYPHADGMRRRRVSQPLGPGHIMGMQQGPGVIMPMHNQPVQILQQNQHQHQHYPSQNSYAPARQNNVTPPYVPQQPGHLPSSYHHQQPFTHTNTQVVLTKQAVNHNKNYREEYSVVKESVGYGGKDPGGFGGDHHRSQHYVSAGYTNYNNQGGYNGPQSAPLPPPPKLHPPQQQRPPQPPQPPQPPKMAHPTVTPSQQINKENEPPLEEDCSDSSNPDTPSGSLSASAVGAKEKTPMCLVNELARFNKITHQYRLTNEMGPAHKKSFTVTLNLGSEEYTAEGASIKKAQHAAAAVALVKTSYTHPTPKNHKHLHMGKANMTPTVELNALAMKRGEPAIYKTIEGPHNQFYQPHQTYTFRRPYAIPSGLYRRGRAVFLRGGRMPFRPTYPQNIHYTVSLRVGASEFTGEGNSPQMARHDAAAKALAHLRLLPIPENSATPTNPAGDTASGIDQEIESSIKSPISLVHEIALKRNMSVLFQVTSEKGPPHMKTFVTECVVGKMRAEGEGNGKKVSKKRAAENMLQELKKLPPLSPTLTCMVNMKRKPPQTKKKTRNLIKITQEQKSESETVEEINPISRLIQIQQLKKEREPVYTLLEEKGARRKREFFMEVAIGQLTAVGCGSNKKIAKKNAAQNLLNIIEARTEQKPGSPSTSDAAKDVKSEKKPDTSGGSSGRQLAPGLLLVSEQHHFSKTSGNSGNGGNGGQSSPKSSEEQVQPTSSSPTSEPPQAKPNPKVFRPKDQLLYLAELLDFQVEFSDYPKANHREFLSLVSLSTNPPQVCHGSGATIEESHDQAASTALRALSEMGLDSVTSAKETKVSQASPGGPVQQ